MTTEISVTAAESEILDAIADTDSQQILGATASEARTVSELVKECDCSTASLYRKVNTLCEVGLLQERVRIRSTGRNSSEYKLTIESIMIEFCANENLEVKITFLPQSTSHDLLQQSPIRQDVLTTDGGRTPNDQNVR